jgi:hypothetical protein
MSRQWKSPALRFWMLQATLCFVLAAAVGLAAIVRSRKVHASRIELEAPETFGTLELRKPAGWTGSPHVDGVTLTEPASAERPGRKLRVWHAVNDVFMSPLEYLVRSGDLSTREATLLLDAGGPDDESVRFRTISIAGWPGVLVSQTRWISAPGVQRPITWKQTLACTILPSGEAVRLRLEGQGVADERDEKLVRRVAEKIILSSSPRPGHRGRLDLGRGIEVLIPDSLAAASMPDSFRTGRTLVAPEGAPWLAVELTPCIWLPGEPPGALASKLAVRDPEFHAGPVRQLDARTWLCERQGDSARLFPASVYLRIEDDGRALLAEFRWNAAAGGHRTVASTWQSLAAGLRFLPEEQTAQQLLRQGADVVRRLPTTPAELFDTLPLRETWQWYHESSPKTSPATLTWQPDALGLHGTVVMESSPPLAGLGGDSTHWRLGTDYVYTSHRQRTSAAGILVQETRSERGKLSMILEDGRGRRLVDRSHTPSDALIPGALIPWVLRRMPYQPLLLQTESILDPGAWVSGDPLTLLLEPAFDLPRYPAGSNEAMRCWKLEVSGSGRSSRWYLSQDGRLEAIAFGGGIHLHRLEPEPATRPATQPATRPAADLEEP